MYIYIYICTLNHFVICLKLTQHWESILFQFFFKGTAWAETSMILSAKLILQRFCKDYNEGDTLILIHTSVDSDKSVN